MAFVYDKSAGKKQKSILARHLLKRKSKGTILETKKLNINN